MDLIWANFKGTFFPLNVFFLPMQRTGIFPSLYLLIKEVRFLPHFFVRFETAPVVD
jgi:hypothetical protein